MKYFISDDHWDIDGYWKQFELLRPRLSKRTYNFFLKHSFHDGLFLNMNVLSLKKPLKLSPKDPTIIEVRILDVNGYEYLIRWSGVVSINMSYDARKKVYIGLDGKEHYYEEDRRGLDEWAYDEITIIDENYLSHEIELHLGAVILLHFKGIDYKRLGKRSWHE